VNKISFLEIKKIIWLCTLMWKWTSQYFMVIFLDLGNDKFQYWFRRKISVEEFEFILEQKSKFLIRLIHKRSSSFLFFSQNNICLLTLSWKDQSQFILITHFYRTKSFPGSLAFTVQWTLTYIKINLNDAICLEKLAGWQLVLFLHFLLLKLELH